MIGFLKKLLFPSQETIDKNIETIWREATDAVRDMCLSCKECKSLAAPLLSNSHRYKCLSCGRQFDAARHDVRASLSRATTDGRAHYVLKDGRYDQILERLKS